MKRTLAASGLALAALVAGGCTCAPLRIASVLDLPQVQLEEIERMGKLPPPADEKAVAPPVDRDTIDLENAEFCDVIDPARCLLPFPNDFFTAADRGAPSGRRVALRKEAMPVNRKRRAIDPEKWNQNDGFSPGPLILTVVPELDLRTTGAPTLTDFARSTEPDSPIQLIEVGERPRRVAVWAELDAQATPSGERALLIRPAANLVDGKRYVVALRRLKNRAGQLIEPALGFRTYRDNLPHGDPKIENRRAGFERIFATLTASGVERSELYLAWDFTVASSKSQSSRLLAMRDDAFARLGARAPRVGRTCHADNSTDKVARRVWGTFRVPSYLEGKGEPGSSLSLGEDGLPKRRGTRKAFFSCIIPYQAFREPARLAIYGHGTLGSLDEVMADDVQAMAAEHNVVFCATNWSGMAAIDYLQAYKILADATDFPPLVDRTHQGILNTLFLGRLMKHPKGLASLKAFQKEDGTPLVDPAKDIVFDGNSQGALLGGTATALTKDWHRAVLAVGGMNYSLILDRSTSFADDPFGIAELDSLEETHEKAYRDPIDQQLVLALMQMLWDRVDLNGHATHLLTDRYPDTSEKAVLLHVGLHDQSVPNVASATLARTLELKARQPVVDPRTLSVGSPFADFRPADARRDTSLLVVWNTGGAPTPPDNTTPEGRNDPHEKVRDDVAVRRQKAAFFDGAILDVCVAGTPCATAGVGEAGVTEAATPAVTSQGAPGSNVSDGPSEDAHDPKEQQP